MNILSCGNTHHQLQWIYCLTLKWEYIFHRGGESLYLIYAYVPGKPGALLTWSVPDDSPLEHSANFLLSSVSPAPGAAGYLMSALPSKLSLKHH